MTTKYTVNSTCIQCGLCESLAPCNFEIQHEGIKEQRQSQVIQQPQDNAEASMCREAYDHCPVEAIEILED